MRMLSFLSALFAAAVALVLASPPAAGAEIVVSLASLPGQFTLCRNLNHKAASTLAVQEYGEYEWYVSIHTLGQDPRVAVVYVSDPDPALHPGYPDDCEPFQVDTKRAIKAALVGDNTPLQVTADTVHSTLTIHVDDSAFPAPATGVSAASDALYAVGDNDVGYATDSIDASPHAWLATDASGDVTGCSPAGSPWCAALDFTRLELIDGAIGPEFSGSWYDPGQSGHGLMLEVLSDNRLLALWFTFDPSGKQAWFGGLGTYVGNVATLTDVVQPLGGRWVTNFDPNAVVRKPWGTLTFTFSDHDHGRVDFDSTVPGFGSGSMNLLRLTNLAHQTAATVPIGSPVGVVTGMDGSVYFSSTPNRVFRVDADGTLVKVAGSGEPGFSGDGGPATQAQLNFPYAYPEYLADPYDYGPMIAGLAFDANTNSLYIADAYNNRVRKIDRNGIITTVVGDGSRANAGDNGPSALASIYWPQGVAVGNDGSLYVSSVWGPVRKVDPSGLITRLANANCGSSYLGPGFCAPENIAFDARDHSILVPDGYCRVRRLVPGISTTTIAGADRRPSNGFEFTCGYDGDGGPATQAALNYPYAVATRSNGEYFIADTYNDCVRRVDAAGVITTYAGRCGLTGFEGDGGPATSARLRKPYAIAVDYLGNLFIADYGNKRLRKVSVDGTISTIAGNGDDLDVGIITPAFSGNWYNPNQSGHGLMLEVLPNSQMLALWFAFDSSGQQSWFGGVGTIQDDNAHIGNVAQPAGGYWIPNFDPAQIDRQPWGSFTLRFRDCSHGSVEFQSLVPGYGSGSLDLLRLTQPAGTSCP